MNLHAQDLPLDLQNFDKNVKTWNETANPTFPMGFMRSNMLGLDLSIKDWFKKLLSNSRV